MPLKVKIRGNANKEAVKGIEDWAFANPEADGKMTVAGTKVLWRPNPKSRINEVQDLQTAEGQSQGASV